MVDYREIARQIAINAHINPDIFVRQINHESGFNPTAYNNQSGASGIAQIIPKYHPGVDPYDPVAALQYAANLMKGFLDKYGNYESALSAYNAGPNGNWSNAETQAYVSDILGNAGIDNGGTNESPKEPINSSNPGCITVGMLPLLWLTLLLSDRISLPRRITQINRP